MYRFLVFLAAVASGLTITATAQAQEASNLGGEGVVEVGSDFLGLGGTAQAQASSCDSGACQSGSSTVSLGISQPATSAAEPASADASLCASDICVEDVAGALPEATLPNVDRVTCALASTCSDGEGDGGSAGEDPARQKGGSASPSGGASDPGHSGGDAGGGTASNDGSAGGDADGAGSPGGAATDGGAAPAPGGEVLGDESPTAAAADGGPATTQAGASASREPDRATATRPGALLGGQPRQAAKTATSLLGTATGPIAAVGWAALGATLLCLLLTTIRRRLERAGNAQDWTP